MGIEPTNHGHAELLTPARNYAVVQLPGRNFPGVVFQGDSLKILLGELREVQESARKGDLEEMHFQLDDVCERLNEILEYYKPICLAAKGTLPFNDSST